MSNDITSKSKLRSEMRALLGSTPEDTISSASLAICQHIADSQDLLHNTQTIAVYAAHGAEVSLAILHRILPTKHLAYPLCHRHSRLSYHLVASPDELTPGMAGIPEPEPGRHKQVSLADIDLILCPGLAFGRDGSRLGQGGGYYDRALEHFTGVTCGVTMARQICPSTPHDVHDIHMDYLASESGILPTRPLQG